MTTLVIGIIESAHVHQEQLRAPSKKERSMATPEELQLKVNELEVRIVALEKTLFGARHGAIESRSSRTVPTSAPTK
jgi:hypothetical protein